MEGLGWREQKRFAKRGKGSWDEVCNLWVICKESACWWCIQSPPMRVCFWDDSTLKMNLRFVWVEVKRMGLEGREGGMRGNRMGERGQAIPL